MPCYDGREELERHARAEKLDKLTRMLCSACTMLSEFIILQEGELAEWWKEHQELDRKHANKEKTE